MTRILAVCISLSQALWIFMDLRVQTTALVCWGRPNGGGHAFIPACSEKRRLIAFLDSWGAPPAQPSIQAFQEHVVSILCAMSRVCSVSDLVHHLTFGCGWGASPVMWCNGSWSIEVSD